jgi:hypothetical protein
MIKPKADQLCEMDQEDRVGGERTMCASTASSLNLRRASARRPLTQLCEDTQQTDLIHACFNIQQLKVSQFCGSSIAGLHKKFTGNPHSVHFSSCSTFVYDCAEKP